MAPTIGKKFTDARTEPSNATWYDSLPVVTRLTNASIALTNGRGVGDGFGDAGAWGPPPCDRVCSLSVPEDSPSDH